ncbi:MAG: hypothetical protein M9921_12540 [Fimbriimonadaceae bacterium]|nr:hypothetical protein [Fimbriimonadaceae bacterium]
MKGFADPERAGKSIERLQALTDLDLGPLWTGAFAECPAPDAALTNFDRWIMASSSPGTTLEHVAQHPRLAPPLALLLGASQPLADALIQNPELASLVLDPSELTVVPQRASIEREGRALLQAAESHAYRRDRLRFLKQRWTVPIAVCDLAGLWEPETVWRALSDVADALLVLAVESTWANFAQGKEVPELCPMMVVAVGKLGGREVNYSSDVDLVYVHVDDIDDALEKHLQRFCELLGRALSERMGRGSLYRVDLRLRPFGGAGPIVRSMRSVEAYYDLHAELWESQALIRSRPLMGPEGLPERWNTMVERTTFGHKLSEFALQEILATRRRIEEHAPEDDLKRGSGGIRDIEFLTQVLQMVYGHADASVREPATCDALRALVKAGRIPDSDGEALIDAYRFLRQVEHRCQLVGDQQTHRIPSQPEAREHLARITGMADWAELEATLSRHRRAVRELFRRILMPLDSGGPPRDSVLGWLGALAPAAGTWFDALPASEAFYRGLSENEGSLGRVKRLLEEAPVLVPTFQQSTALTERILSGEIEELEDVAARIAQLPPDTPLDQVADALVSAKATLATRWLLGSDEQLGVELCRLWDAALRHCHARLYATFDLVALGSYALTDSSFGSDLDMVFLVEDPRLQNEAELQAQQFIAMLARLRRLGAVPGVDLRLRPEGRQGLLVRTYEGLRAYELERMEMWERFALGFSRPVHAASRAAAELLRAAYAMPLSPPRMKELVAMKKRIESERVMPQHVHRHVKLGHGGLSDIEWFVHLYEMRYPTATAAGEATTMLDRLRALSRAHLINAVEFSELVEGRAHLLDVRNRLALLDYAGDLVPENPDKLDRLAHGMGFETGNAFLAFHGQVTGTVRTIYEEGLERLNA